MPRLIVSQELLNAFVDNQLEPGEKDLAFEEIARDETLHDQVCQLREMKAMVQHAYDDPPEPSPFLPGQRHMLANPYSGLKRAAYPLRSFATCALLLAIGGASGWLIASQQAAQSRHEMGLLFPVISHYNMPAKSDNIVIQVGNSDPVRIETALDASERLLRTSRRAHKNVKVEIIANNSGLDLLRSDVSRYARRVALMEAKYPNLKFVACGLTLNRLKKKGVKVHLLPNTGSVPSAPAEITRRLQQGWDYIRM